MIPQFEPKMQYSYAEAVKLRVSTGWIGNGSAVKELEYEFSKYVKSKYAIATTSGTAALLVSMCALGLKARDKIVLPNYSFIAATNVSRFLKLNLTLVDIDKETLCIDPNILKTAIKDANAVVFVNHNGYVGNDLLWVKGICEESKIPLIEDSAGALGQWYKGKHAGTVGDIGCFSFSVPKPITTGQGGMIVTDDDSLYNKCREIIDQGSTTWRQDGYHKNIGLNFKYNDVLASLGLMQMKNLNYIFKQRYNIYRMYKDRGLDLHYFDADVKTGPWMNILLNVEANSLKERLHTLGVESKMSYRPINECIGYKSDQFPNSLDVYNSSLYLPSSLTLKEEEIDFICGAINEYTSS